MNNMATGKRIPEETKVSVQALRLRGVISHDKGVLTCERYENIDAQYFTSFIDQHFDTCLKDLVKD